MSIFQGMPICHTPSRIQIDMATINVDFPRFLLPKVMPQHDTLKHSSPFLRSDGIDTRCCLKEQGVTALLFQRMNVKTPRHICSPMLDNVCPTIFARSNVG